MDTLRNKIKGALYGFAIGDALGATNEFRTKHEIEKLGKIKSLVGGGWLNLQPGEVTDDTQMMLCVIDALMSSQDEVEFETNCTNNFVNWLHSNPKDIGGCCLASIQKLEAGLYVEYDSSALGNGALMRALPCALLGNVQYNVIQGSLTHNNVTCARYISTYTSEVLNLLFPCAKQKNCHIEVLCHKTPSGHVLNTLNNALYWSRTFAVNESIYEAANDGGDSDTIAALTGGLSGAQHGFDALNKEWVAQLDENVKHKLDEFVDFVDNYYNTL